MKKKVAMLLFSPYPVDSRVFKEAKSLINSKTFELTVFAWKRPNDANYEIIDEIKTIRINTGSQTDIKTIRHLFLFNLCLFFLLIRLPRFSVYHAHEFTTLPIAFVISKIKKSKIVYDSHEYYPALLASDKIIWRPLIFFVMFLEKYLSNRVDLVYTATYSQTQLFITKYKIKNYHTIFNAPLISQKRIDQLFAEKEAIRRKWKIDKSDFVIVYPGAINPGRCLDELIKIVPALSKVKKTKVIIIGPSSTKSGYRDLLKSLIYSLGIQREVFIFDAISDEEVNELFCICDLVYALYPKIRDYSIAIPGKILRAVRFHKKFITSDFGEMKVLAEKFPFGIAINTSNPTEITTGLKNAMLTDFEYDENDLREFEELWWQNQEIKVQNSYISLFTG